MRGASSGKPRPITKKLARGCRPAIREFPSRRTNGEQGVKPKNKCGPDQPSEPHRSWISLSPAFPTLGAAGRRYWSDSAHWERRSYQYWLQTAIRRIAFRNLCGGPADQPAPRAGSGGGRNARATSTRSRAFPISPGNSPSRIASCHQRHRNHRSTSF
jgi:hypothetical protein